MRILVVEDQKDLNEIIVRKLTNEQISLELNERNQLRISYSDSEGYIQCMDVLEFPELKNVDKVQYFEK